MKKIINRYVFLLFLFSQIGLSQSVTVNVQVLPPYSTYLPDYLNYSNRIVFTMMSFRDAQVKLKASITGDNGISITTSERANVSPINLIGNQLRSFTGNDLKNYLDINSVIITGIDKNQLYRGTGLPEGNYTVCIQALDYTTNEPLSYSEPLGCSNPFSILQIYPPQLIAPICDEKIEATSMQNIIFSWLPPANSPTTGVKYKLKIVELIPSTRNPNEAMNSATTPAFFETETLSPSYVYTTAQPKLKSGYKYAWRVTVMSSNVTSGRGANDNFQNNGNSEVCSFLYQQSQTSIDNTPPIQNGIKLLSPIERKTIPVGIPSELVWESSNNPKVAEYKVLITNSVNDKKTIKEWSDVSENLLKYEYNYSTFSAHKNLTYSLPTQIYNERGKYVWRIIALDNSNKIIDQSELGLFEINQIKQEIKSTITLINPIKAKQIPAGASYTFEWTSSQNKSVDGYNLEGVYLDDNDKVSSALFEDKSKNIMTLGPFTTTTFNFKSKVDADNRKIAWRIVGLSKDQPVDISPVESYEIVEDKSDLANLKSLMINDYTIQINQIYSTDQDNYSGSGRILLWEGGKEVFFNFKNLKVRPIAYFPKIKKYEYAVIDGTIDVNESGIYPNKRIDLSTCKDCDGAFEANLKSMKIVAKLEGDMNKDLFKIAKNLGTTEGKISAKWFSNFFLPKSEQSSESTQYIFESVSDGSVMMSFKDKFEGSLFLKNKKMLEQANSLIEVDFSPIGGIKLNIKGLEAETILSGTVKIPNAKPNGTDYKSFTNLEIPFKEEKNLNFQYQFDSPLIWAINEDNSVSAKVSEVYVHLSEEGKIDTKYDLYMNGLNFDKFGVIVNLPIKKGTTKPPKSLDMYFDKIYNNGKGYNTISKSGVETKNSVNIAGFSSKLSKSTFMIKNNKLIYLYLDGNMYVPFLNDWAGLLMNIDDKKIQEINLSFDWNKKYYLSKQSGGSAFITVSSGRLENNSIVISPSITVKSAEKKGFETENMSMCEIYINSNGTVSYDSNFNENSESICEGTKHWATYYKFSYGVDKMKIKRNTIKTDATFLFTGDVILGPNIANNDKKEMGFIYHGTEPNPNENEIYNIGSGSQNQGQMTVPKGINAPKGGYKGPSFETEHYINPLENSLEISDDGKEINAGYEDGAQKFGGGFKIGHDDKWGDYFKLNGSYQAKEPEVKDITASLILGKTLKENGNYTYWFFEFYQKGFVTVPIVPGIIEAHGFGGKAYYHIEPTYDNLGKITDMKPNNAYSLGIAAEADVRTSYDNGKTIHGHVMIVTQFKGWSIDGISYYIKADAVADDSNSPGMLQARLNGQMNWVKKYIDGQGQVWGNVKDFVCINEGKASEDSVFFHFGVDDFYLKIGTPENPIVADVMCGSGLSMGVWFNLDTKHIAAGLEEKYDSGWKGLDLKIASGEGRLKSNFTASLGVNYSPFKIEGSASFSGRAYGRGCVDLKLYSGCISGSCGINKAILSISAPSPTVFQGSIECDVHKYIPNFTLNARWSSNDGFDIWL